MYLDKQHPRPIYLQLKELLQNQIEQGVYLSHQKLPSERDLCQHHDLSRMTARRALQALIAEGFAYTRAGKGTFVSASPKLVKDAPPDEEPEPAGSRLFGKISISDSRQRLLKTLLTIDCVGVERAISEILAIHPLEAVARELFLDIIRSLEQQWLQNEVSLVVHNYAITTLRSQLIAMMNATAMPKAGPKVLLACAPGDNHEIGLLLLGMSLRRRGFLVIYLGPHLTVNEFHQVLEIARPQLVCLSAATAQSVESLTRFAQIHQERLTLTRRNSGSTQSVPLFTFGGVAFYQNQKLAANVPGLFLGNTIDNALLKIQDLVSA